MQRNFTYSVRWEVWISGHLTLRYGQAWWPTPVISALRHTGLWNWGQPGSKYGTLDQQHIYLYNTSVTLFYLRMVVTAFHQEEEATWRTVLSISEKCPFTLYGLYHMKTKFLNRFYNTIGANLNTKFFSETWFCYKVAVSENSMIL